MTQHRLLLPAEFTLPQAHPKNATPRPPCLQPLRPDLGAWHRGRRRRSSQPALPS
jgi:hypothetical protein